MGEMQREVFLAGGRECTVFSAEQPEVIVIQPVDDHELESLDREIAAIKALTDRPLIFAGFRVVDWNSELSPWEAPAVFGDAPFGKGAAETLAELENRLIPELIGRYSLGADVPVILGGYSLAGLFALWAGFSSERFTSAAGVSPSVWFPGWTEFAEERSPAVRSIYLSLGRKEEKARNKTMAAVGNNIRRLHDILLSKNIPSILEWNEGGHFNEPELRTARGIAWCINETARA